MKNTINKLILLSLITILATGCQDMLDIKPTTFISEDLVFEDSVLINEFVANTYGSMLCGFDRCTDGFGQGWSRAFAGNLDSGTDDFACHSDSRIYTELQKDAITSQSCPFIDEIWIQEYAVIRKCNIIIENILNVDSKVIAKNTQLRIEAEARFLRAFCYFELARTFGKAPIITNAQAMDDNLQVAPSSFTDIVNFINEECDSYAGNLPLSYSSAETGHATRGAFLALKSRALLYLASPLNSTDDSQKWSMAAKAAKAVIDLTENGSPVYQLYNNGTEPYYAMFFDKTTINKEMIFERRYSYPKAPHNLYMMWAMSTISWNTLYPTQNLVDAYETTDGKSIDDSTNTLYNSKKPYLNRDARLKQSIIYNGAQWTGVGFDIASFMGVNKARCGYGLLKFIERLDENSQNVYGSYAQSNNFPYFRYAEILLNYAEARNESLQTPDDSVYLAINQIRTRAGQPNLPTGLSKDDMRKRIKNERRVELLLEEHRFYDLRRWKDGDVLAQPIRGITFKSGKIDKIREIEKRVFTGEHYYLPIPLSEQLKNPLLKD